MTRYLLAIAVWFLIIPVAILNGGFREYVLVYKGGASLPLSGIILSICIFVVAFLLIPRIRHCKRRDYYFFGLIWFALTNLFDYGMYAMDGGGFGELLQSYHFFSSNLWILVVLSSLCAPPLVMKMRNLPSRG